ncbi:MAG: hypothetical protein JWO89_1729, partial [Verrucomicrobiaceae bacterium]|nr:hypothetical protein [Verrucomicrobiaceae bacterium]
MNPNDCDHPDLTAHLLGELDAEHAEAMAKWIESSPEARAEATQISDLARLLAETAPVSFHTLRPEQRTAVLSGPQRVRQMVAAVQKPKRRASMPMVWGGVRLAAAAAIAVTGYVVGVHFGSRQGDETTVVATPPATAPVEKETPKTPPFRAKEIPAMVADIAPQKPEQKIRAKTPEVKAETVVAAAPPKVEPTTVVQPKPAVILASNVIHGQPFVTASKNAVALVTLRPSATRPTSTAASEGGPVFGSPMTSTAKKDAASRTSKQPDLWIHSWKADVSSCPWDESHRLVRLVVQIPGEQDAAKSSANSYALQITFSPGAVRSFRQLGERTVPAQQGDSPAFHITWFEVVPNGPLPEGGTRTLGDIMVPNARFTTQAMAPFDRSKLHVLDRGTSWQNAREDFLFESAVVGFGLLLEGEKDNGSLNLAMVNDLAERAKLDEHNAEHTKFIKLVKD